MAQSIFDIQWIHGGNCVPSGDTPLQVFQFDRDTFVLRESKCVSFEGNFLYLLFGTQKAILFDSGAGPDTSGTPAPPVRATVQAIIAQWLAARSQHSIDLIVAHTHGHGDHFAGDDQFRDQPHTQSCRPGRRERSSVAELAQGAITSTSAAARW